MKTTIKFALVLLPLTLASSLPAQNAADQAGPRRGGPGGRGPGVALVVRALDTDKDREISGTEIANASVTLRGLDLDGDSVVSEDELRPIRSGKAVVRPVSATNTSVRQRPIDPVMLALDANLDGSLAAAEIANAATSLAALDFNHDGKLSAEELRTLPPETI